MPQSNVFSGPFSLTSQGVTDALGYIPLNKAGDTMLGDLKFTDATYDIGKTGATRPRDLFYSRTGQGGTLALGGAVIGSNALAVVGTAEFSSLAKLTGTSTINYTAVEVENLSVVNNTTKAISCDFYGRDTINTRKIVGRIAVVPSDPNWAGGGAGGIEFSPETSDGVISATVRMPHAGGLSVLSGLTNLAGGLTHAVAQKHTVGSGAGQRAGNATLVGGTVTVSNTTITANTVVLLTRKTSGGTIGMAVNYTLSAGASFTITSDNALDTSVYSYWLIEVV